MVCVAKLQMFCETRINSFSSIEKRIDSPNMEAYRPPPRLDAFELFLLLDTKLKGLDMITRTLRRTARRIIDMADRRRAILALARMQDWRLADLGIERGRIPEIVDGLIARRNAVSDTPNAAAPPDTAAGTLPPGPVSGVTA